MRYVLFWDDDDGKFSSMDFKEKPENFSIFGTKCAVLIDRKGRRGPEVVEIYPKGKG